MDGQCAASRVITLITHDHHGRCCYGFGPQAPPERLWAGPGGLSGNTCLVDHERHSRPSLPVPGRPKHPPVCHVGGRVVRVPWDGPDLHSSSQHNSREHLCSLFVLSWFPMKISRVSPPSVTCLSQLEKPLCAPLGLPDSEDPGPSPVQPRPDSTDLSEPSRKPRRPTPELQATNPPDALPSSRVQQMADTVPFGIQPAPLENSLSVILGKERKRGEKKKLSE